MTFVPPEVTLVVAHSTRAEQRRKLKGLELYKCI